MAVGVKHKISFPRKNVWKTYILPIFAIETFKYDADNDIICIGRMRSMLPTETRISVIIDKDIWKLVQLIASNHLCTRDNGSTTPCTGSDIIREELDDWLTDKASEWFPKLLREFKEHGVQSRARDLLEEWQKEKEEEK